MRLLELKSIHYDNWRLPNDVELRKEMSLKHAKPLKRYYSELGISGANCWDSFENVKKAVKKGRVERLPYNRYYEIGRLSGGSSLEAMRKMSLNYNSGPRDPYKIAKGFEDNDAIPMAIIIDNGGELILTAGNTRLNSAKICGVNPSPKILIIPARI